MHLSENYNDIGVAVQAGADRLSALLKIPETKCSYELDIVEHAIFGNEVVVRTDVVQRLAARSRLSEHVVTSAAMAELATDFHVANSALKARNLVWTSHDKFLNIEPARFNPAQREAGIASSEGLNLNFESSLALPTNIYSFCPSISQRTITAATTGWPRLAARLALQRMALTLLKMPTQFRYVDAAQLSEIANDVAIERATGFLASVWVYPQSIERAILSPALRNLGCVNRALLESITSEEWGSVAHLPEISSLQRGQLLALAQYNLSSDVDIVGAGRQEIQNLPWLMASICERLGSIFDSSATASSLAGAAPSSIFSDVMRIMSLRNVALRCAARGKVAAYVGFWQQIALHILRIINNPTIRMRVARGEISEYDLSCSRLLRSVLSENIAAWENHIHKELILP